MLSYVALALVSFSQAHGAAATAADLQTFASLVASRRSTFENFEASGSEIRARVSTSGLIALAALVSEPRSFRPTTFPQQVLDLTPGREFFEYRLRIAPEGVAIERRRDLELDNCAAALSAVAAPGQIAQARALRERIVVAGDDIVRVREGYEVSFIEPFSRDGLVAKTEMSLVDWSGVTADQLHRPDQIRTYTHDEATGLGILRYSSTTGSVTDYVFEPTCGFRPIRSSLTRGDESRRRRDYGYAESDRCGLPCLALDADLVGPDQWRVSVLLLTAVDLSPAAFQHELRLPAIRAELREHEDGENVRVFRVFPLEVATAPPADRLAVAIGLVVQHWGSPEPEYDLDGSGAVDGGDLARALELLQ